MTEWKRFLVERHDDGVAHLVMNRPEKLNAMDRLFFDELSALTGMLGEDTDVGAVVLRGAGRCFSAGGDIATFPALAGDMEAARDHIAAVFASFHSIETCDVPVIAAVHGIAHGGGTEITMACDIAIGATDARFSFREAGYGLVAGFGVTRSPDKIGPAWAARMAMSTEELDAAAALRMGLLTEVVAPAELIDHAHRLAAAIAANSRPAISMIKHHVNRHTADGIDRAVEITALSFQTEDSRVAVQAFLDRER